MPRNTQLPQATPQKITSQPRAVPNFMAQGPHCTVQGMPRKHQAQATHRNSTNDPTIPTSPAGTYSLNKVPLSQFPTHWVRSLQAEALLWHPDPTVRCLRSTMVPHGTLLEDTWLPHHCHTRKPCPIKARHMRKSFSICMAPTAHSPHSARAPTPQGISAAGAGGLGQEKAQVPCESQ